MRRVLTSFVRATQRNGNLLAPQRPRTFRLLSTFFPFSSPLFLPPPVSPPCRCTNTSYFCCAPSEPRRRNPPNPLHHRAQTQLCYAVTTALSGAQALRAINHSLSLIVGIVILTVIVMILAVWGYQVRPPPPFSLPSLGRVADGCL